MKLLAAATFAFTTSVLATAATTARADDDMPAPRIEHRSKGAHAAGVALTVTGITFFGLGGVASAGALFTLAGGFGRDTGGGFGTLLGGILFGMVAGGCTALGLSTFIPGIVLMNNNAAPKSPDLEARKVTPAPSFTTFPIVSATF
jgi:hypothetical protein